MKNSILSLILSIVSVEVWGFTLNPSNNSNFRGWRSSEIQFAINSTNCPAGLNVQDLLEKSFEVWNQVPTSKMKLKIVGTTSATTASNPNVVVCSTNFASDLGVTDPVQAGEIEDSVPGAALLSTSGDFAVSGLLVLNASGGDANIGLFNQTLLKVILAHEVGHIIGLGHSQDLNALMYYNAAAKNTLALAQDDVDGVTYLYPRNELAGDQMMGCGLVKENHSGGPSNLGFKYLISILGFLLLPLLLATRLRGGFSHARSDFFK